jgi:tRNA dimethylallyltransferase
MAPDSQPRHIAACHLFPYSLGMGERDSQTVFIVAGPTASGKSAMQVYRDIPILSAQPSPEDRAVAPHHLYGFHPITQNYSSAEWARDAYAAIMATRESGLQPILVGGSGLYLKALTEGFSPMPDVPAAVRQHVGALYDMLGPQGFHDALKKIDPLSAERLHPGDRQRCIRAREVFEASGEALSAWQARPKRSVAPDLTFKSLVLLPDRDWLHKRINDRFAAMVKAGALDEARAVQSLSQENAVTGSHALGLHALWDHLNGVITLDQAIQEGQTQSRQYAKRQYTWFRGQALPNAVTFENAPHTWASRAADYFS